MWHRWQNDPFSNQRSPVWTSSWANFGRYFSVNNEKKPGKDRKKTYSGKGGFINMIMTCSARRWDLTKCRVGGSVWPEGEIKSSHIFLRKLPKSSCNSFYLKINVSRNSPKKLPENLAVFVRKFCCKDPYRMAQSGHSAELWKDEWRTKGFPNFTIRCRQNWKGVDRAPYLPLKFPTFDSEDSKRFRADLD